MDNFITKKYMKKTFFILSIFLVHICNGQCHKYDTAKMNIQNVSGNRIDSAIYHCSFRIVEVGNPYPLQKQLTKNLSVQFSFPANYSQVQCIDSIYVRCYRYFITNPYFKSW